jgi:DNA (cytosine-5)-methyltransferase 1
VGGEMIEKPNNHKFPYKWYLRDGYPAKGIAKHNSKVFSCFAGGGGSTMGYKLAGYDVIGCNEIDPKMNECYVANHNPKFNYLMDIRKFRKLDSLPKELFNLYILDGSPPCSSFSMAGNREKDWGKEKKFREGQQKQTLDDLFFEFIELGKRLQPKIIIAENVKGLLQGEAKKYVTKIGLAFEDAGYYVHKWLLDASKMGVPQRRERVFFIAMRKDLANKFGSSMDMFNPMPKLGLGFNERVIPFKEIEDFENKVGETKLYPSTRKLYPLVGEGCSFSTQHETGSMHSMYKVHRDKPLATITAHLNGGDGYHYEKMRTLTTDELKLGGTYPIDYNFRSNKVKYLVGMSVPPVMTAQIADRIYNQWIKEIK